MIGEAAPFLPFLSQYFGSVKPLGGFMKKPPSGNEAAILTLQKDVWERRGGVPRPRSLQVLWAGWLTFGRGSSFKCGAIRRGGDRRVGAAEAEGGGFYPHRNRPENRYCGDPAR